MVEISDSNELINAIVNLVINHTYKPGDRIFETALAQQLGVSRTPIREALASLVFLGFLERTEARKGYVIPPLTPEDMHIVFSTRRLLEGEAASLAAKQGTVEETAYLSELNRLETEAFDRGRREEYAKINEKYHIHIARMSGNSYLERCIKQLLLRASLYNFFLLGFYTLGSQEGKNRLELDRLSCEEHRLTIEAISNRDDTTAGERMRGHIRSTYDHLVNPGLS